MVILNIYNKDKFLDILVLSLINNLSLAKQTIFYSFYKQQLLL